MMMSLPAGIDLAAIRDEWLAVGLSTGDSIDEDAVRAALVATYAAAGLTAPTTLIVLDSPLAGAVGAAMLAGTGRAQVRDQVRDQVWDQVGAQVWAQVRDQVRAQVRDQVRAQVRDQVRDQVWDQVWAQVWAQVRDQVWDQVRDQVRDQVWDQVGAQVEDQVYRAGYGTHDAGWLSFYATIRAAGLSCCDRLDGLMRLSRIVGWWWPFAGACIVTRRPTELHRDDGGRLHRLDGPAIRYRDGFRLYRWHGVTVPEDIVLHPDRLTIDRINAESNAEVRRVMIDRYGVARYTSECGVCIDDSTDETGQPLRLYRRELAGDEPIVMVAMLNSTPDADGSRRQYMRRVPPSITSAIDARNWTCYYPPGSRVDVQT